MARPVHKYYPTIKKYLTLRNVLLAGLIVIIYMMFSNLAKAIIFIIIFAPLCTMSIKITRVIPNANVQLITPFTFFIGYRFGWPLGVFFGVLLGLYFWSTAYSISQFVLLEVFLNGILAVIANFMANTFSWSFLVAYIIGMLIQKVLYFTMGLAIGGNPVENTIHTVSSTITHILILPTIMVIIYNVSNWF